MSSVNWRWFDKAKKKKILCLKAAAHICISVRIWFCKIQTFIFFFLKLFFFHFYNEKQRKFAVLEEFKHVGTKKKHVKSCLISENTEVETFQSFLVSDVCVEAKANWSKKKIKLKIKNRMPRRFEKFSQALRQSIFFCSLRLKKKKILCLKAAARICFSVRIWFCKIQTFIFFSWNYFFHFYNEKQRKFAVLEEFKHVGTQKNM